MDFRTPHTVGERINDKFQQLIFGAGYDHCYVLNKIESGSLDLAATCKDPKSGRIMEVYTTEAGVQLYTGNWLNGFEGAHGATFPTRKKEWKNHCNHYDDFPFRYDFICYQPRCSYGYRVEKPV